MNLITWNCQGAFRKKAEIILQHQPDILVIQECENPDKLVFNPKTQRPNDFLWFGDNEHKGLGVFSYSKYKFQLIKQHNAEIKFVVPISVIGGQIDFKLFAIWANNPKDQAGRYIEQVWKAVNHYDQLLNQGRVIFIGDFNSNKIWDKKHKIANHSDVVDRLAQKNIFSIYHSQLKQEQGKETHPTFFLHRKIDKQYHIDYCFTSADLYDKVKNLEIGSYENWANHSDHTPLIINFDL